MQAQENAAAEDTMGEDSGIRLGPNRMTMFRRKAIDRHANTTEGVTIIATPISFSMYTLGAMILLLAIVCFTMLGRYTRTESSKSVIVPRDGFAKVLWPMDGRVETRLAQTGAALSEGDPVAEICAPRPEETAPSPSTGHVRPCSTATDALESEGAEKPDAAHAVTVRAPARGLLYRISAQPGEQASRSQEFATIAREGPLVVLAEISEQARVSLKPNTEIRLALAGDSLGSDSAIKARVSRISIAPTENRNPFVDQTAYTYTMVAQIDMESTRLGREELLGRTVTVRIPTQSRKIYQWLLDPLKALVK